MCNWYQAAFRLITNPYTFFEERLAQGSPYPAGIFFLATLCVNTLGWYLFSPRYYSMPNANLGGSFLLSLLTYPAAVLVIYLVSHSLVNQNKLSSFFAAWGFSYLPTLFLSLLNITAHSLSSTPGVRILLSYPWATFLIWAVIFLFFLWKLLLLATTLRLAGNLNLSQIVIAMLLLALITAGYWRLILFLGWSKLPFI